LPNRLSELSFCFRELRVRRKKCGPRRHRSVLSAWPVHLVARIEREPQKVRCPICAVLKAVKFAKGRKVGMVQFIARQYRMERKIPESVYATIMETLDPTL
jgi:hypothetical protein